MLLTLDLGVEGVYAYTTSMICEYRYKCILLSHSSCLVSVMYRKLRRYTMLLLGRWPHFTKTNCSSDYNLTIFTTNPDQNLSWADKTTETWPISDWKLILSAACCYCYCLLSGVWSSRYPNLKIWRINKFPKQCNKNAKGSFTYYVITKGVSEWLR